MRNYRAEALIVAKQERIKQDAIDAQKQPQVILSTEDRIKATIAARKAREGLNK